MRRVLRVPFSVIVAVAFALTSFVGSTARAEDGDPDWFSGKFEIHGFLTSKLYVRAPSLKLGDSRISSWRSEMNLEPSLQIVDTDDFKLGVYAVVRPVYDAIYEIHPHLWGEDAVGGSFGTARFDLAHSQMEGRSVSLVDPTTGNIIGKSGACHPGSFCLANADTGSLFDPEGDLTPAIIIDDNVFFGRVTAPFLPRGGNQPAIGGNASGDTYRDFLNAPLRQFGAVQAFRPLANIGLANSLARASQPLGAPLNYYYRGGIGDRRSLTQAPVDFNRRESQLATDFGDNAHYLGPLREIYTDIEFGNTRIRLGRQQIVWGKTDAFRLQDVINPLDVGYHNVFPDLEERRIPVFALDAIHSFGNIDALGIQDLSLEIVWNFDRFVPLQFGQCGEPYAFTASCESRADAGGHQLLNLSLARVQQRDWNIKNTQPGARVEWRIPEPSIAFSLSAYYHFQDLPAVRSVNQYSFSNPNPAAMLFLQGLGIGQLTELLTGGPGAIGTSPWTTGFDPYEARQPDGTIINGASGMALANNQARQAWMNIYDTFAAQGLSNKQIANCLFDASVCPVNTGLEGTQAIGLLWSASEFELDYPRILTLGGSLDYQIPGADTVVRMEMAYDINRKFINTASPDARDHSDLYSVSIGLDRPTYIPFLNKDRTAFISFQTFLSHVISYDNGTGWGDGFVDPENQIISTFFMQNYWRNDSIVLTNFVAYDWNAQALITGPSVKYIYNEHLSFEVGLNLLWGNQNQQHNIKDLCADHTLSCLRDPATWQAGNWQQLNKQFERTPTSPWFGRQSFADQFMEDRDEIWMGVTYQF